MGCCRTIAVRWSMHRCRETAVRTAQVSREKFDGEISYRGQTGTTSERVLTSMNTGEAAGLIPHIFR
jgi:hypothetical protein